MFANDLKSSADRKNSQGRWTVRWELVALLGALIVAVILLSGCGDVISAPGQRSLEPASLIGETLPDIPPVLPDSLLGDVIDSTEVVLDDLLGKPLIKTHVINGDTGTTVVQGRLTLTFPPGSVTGTQTLTITQPDDTVALWEFDITGSREFPRALTAVIDYSGTTASGIHTMVWLDESNLTWVDVGGVDNPDTKTFKVNLHHFSTYAMVGKDWMVKDGTAGWN